MENFILNAKEYVYITLVIFIISVVTKSYVIFVINTIIFYCLLYFFRGWRNNITSLHKNILYCPCDGVVKQIYDTGSHIHITVFLNIHNIHVQYAPFYCIVRAITYKKGEFHPAYLLEKSAYNERQEYILSNEYFGDVKFVQIAGQVARRIQSFVKINTNVKDNLRFFCSTALTSAGWVRMTIKLQHCPPTKRCGSH